MHLKFFKKVSLSPRIIDVENAFDGLPFCFTLWLNPIYLILVIKLVTE